MFALSDLHQLERLISDGAQAELLSRFERVGQSTKADGSVLTEADLAMQSSMLAALRAHWPDYAQLGEEMGAAEQQACLQQQDQGVWVLDPLDGTANYAAGIPYFGVSLALVQHGQVIAGVVHDPVRAETFSALRGEGAWLNGKPLRLPAAAPALSAAMGMVDLKRLPAELIARLAKQAPYRSQRSFGSVALDWCWLAAGRVQVYLHGGQRLWDYAAGNLVFTEAGGAGGVYQDLSAAQAAAMDLQPKVGMAASDAELFAQWQAWLQGAS